MLISKYNIFEVPPNLLLLVTFLPDICVDHLNLVVSHYPCAVVAQPYAYLQKISTLRISVDIQWYAQPPKASLNQPHSPFYCLTEGEQLIINGNECFLFICILGKSCALLNRCADAAIYLCCSLRKCSISNQIKPIRCLVTELVVYSLSDA